MNYLPKIIFLRTRVNNHSKVKNKSQVIRFGQKFVISGGDQKCNTEGDSVLVAEKNILKSQSYFSVRNGSS